MGDRQFHGEQLTISEGDGTTALYICIACIAGTVHRGDGSVDANLMHRCPRDAEPSPRGVSYHR
jgi:hypothetical protein